MKEFKILAVIVALVGITYYGIEPYAHSVMHPEVAPADFKYDGKQEVSLYLLDAKTKVEEANKLLATLKEELSLAKDAEKAELSEKIAKLENDIKTIPVNAKAEADARTAFWTKANETSLIKGDVANGKTLVEDNCLACHAIEKAGHPAIMPNADAAASYGVVPPDLSEAGRIYDKKYLTAFIMNPVNAMHLQHKYTPESGKAFPMPSYEWMAPQEIMDVVAYLQSVAPKVTEGKEAHKATFEAACGRCHNMKYGGIASTTPVDNLKNYMGATPPDLSQYIKSRGEHYLHSFINDPQLLLKGTSMPRVGLSEKAQEEVIAYMEEVGDSKKAERESLGVWVLLYTFVFAILAYLWKRKIWSEVH